MHHPVNSEQSWNNSIKFLLGGEKEENLIGI